MVITNYLHGAGLNYQYERPLEGPSAPERLRPDFTFIDDSGDVIVLKHLGMRDRPDYMRSWDWKKEWYRTNGFQENDNLFTTREDPGLDMTSITAVTEKVKAALA